MEQRSSTLASFGVALALAGILIGCGDGDNDGPAFVTVPLACDARLDRLEERANWPDAATLDDLQGVNDDLFAVLNGLDEDCDPAVFERYDRIKCAYFTSVSGIGPAAEAFVATQAGQCGDDGPDPDDPVATVEVPGSDDLPLDRCEQARQDLELEGIIPDETNMPSGCDS